MAGGDLVRDVLAVFEVVVSFVKEGFESLTADSDKYQVFCDLNELYECCVLFEEHFPCDESERLVMTNAIGHLLSSMNAQIGVCRRKGRPRIEISQQQLESLCSHDFSLKDMSHILNKTVTRRLHDIGLSRRSRYSDNANAELDGMVTAIETEHPDTGYRMIDGTLRANGVIIQRECIRESLKRVDPDGTQRRLNRALHRRQYSVPSPNWGPTKSTRLWIWHIDGNHKLVRW